MAIKQVGTKVYYCTLSGNVIKIIGDMQGHVRETTFDEDYEIYPELKEREKETVGLINVPFGQYSKLSANSTGVKVNITSKELEFTYEPLPEIPHEPTPLELMAEELKSIREELSSTQEALNDIIFKNTPPTEEIAPTPEGDKEIVEENNKEVVK